MISLIKQYFTEDRKLDSWIYKLLPVGIFSGALISLLLCFYGYPIFGENENLRLIVSGLLNGILTILFFLLFIKLLYHKKSRKKVLIAFIPIAVWFILCIIPILREGISFFYIFQLMQLLLFGMQMYLVACIVVLRGEISDFIKNIDIYGIILIPFCVFYIIRYLVYSNASGGGLNSFAGMSYMSISFIFLPIVCFMICQHLFYDITMKKKIFHIGCSTLYWVVIVVSGTRSAILCVAFFFVCMVMLLVGVKKYNKIKSVLMYCIIYIALFFSLIYFVLPSITSYDVRSKNFNYDSEIYQAAEQEKIEVKSSTGEIVNLNIQEYYVDYIVSSPQNIKFSLNELHKNLSNEKRILNFNSVEDETKFKNFELYFGRNLLFDLSIREAENSLVLGHGSNYYQQKYNNYPHNSFLEVLCDFGIIGLTFMIFVIVYIIIKLIPISFKNRGIASIFMLCMMWAPISCLSGTIYLNYNLIFSIVFGIVCICSKEELVNDEKEKIC